MQEKVSEEEMVTPGEVLGKGSEVKAGKGAYLSHHNNTVYASLTGRRSLSAASPESPDQVIHMYTSTYQIIYWCLIRILFRLPQIHQL